MLKLKNLETVTLIRRLVKELFLLVAEILYIFVKSLFFCLESLLDKSLLPRPEKSLQNEVILVTGAGHGIGREVALQLSTHGCQIVCWDVNIQTCSDTVEKLRSTGCIAWAFQCDVSCREAVKNAAERTRNIITSPVTMLFNNAGIMPCKPFEEHSPEDVEKMFKVNVFSHFWTLFEFLPDLRKAPNGGHVIAMSSTAGVIGTPNLTGYCASKHAIKGLMDALHLEFRLFGDSLQLTTIYPFVIRTGLAQKPLSRFEWLIPITEVEVAAAKIIQAIRRNQNSIYIPSHLEAMFELIHVLPLKARLLAMDFMGCGVLPHLE